MHVPVSVNRACLRLARALFHFFLFSEIFPRTDSNPDYPGALVFNNIIRALWDEYYLLHAAGKTALASQKFVQIQEATINLMIYVEGACGDDAIKLEESGFTANKQTKTKEPQTNVPKDLMKMIQGHGNFKIEYTCDEFMHYCKGRTRKKGATDADWVIKESSENQTMLFTDYVHGEEMEVQISACGTAGESYFSESIFVLVD